MDPITSSLVTPQELNDLRQKFETHFGHGGRLRIIRAPGRVNLIGEHTDYNDGFVFPMAIEPHVLLAVRSRDDGLVRLSSTQFTGQIVEFSVQKPITRGEPKWANYPRGVAAELIGAGIPLVGMDCLISNTLPPGGGLSSSAALEVGTGRALLTLAGLDMDLGRLALLCQKAEHEYALVPCGIMDQTIVALGRPGHAMLLDCRDLSKKFVPIDARDLRVVVVNTMVRHELSGGEYAERRHQCEEGVEHFKRVNPQVKALRDLTMKDIDSAKGKLSDVVFRRCRHVVGENDRTTRAASALSQRNYTEAGQLMVASHESLRDDYEVSCPELDFLASASMRTKGVYGARMTGGGFGGCMVALVQPALSDAYIEQIKKVYKAEYDIDPVAFATTATAGAGVVE